MGAILEIRIPKEKLRKYKTEHGMDKYIRMAVWNFMNAGLKKIGSLDVIYTNGMDTAYDGEELCEIHDFDYSGTNKVKQNEDKRTFRFFGGKIMSIVSEDVKIPNDKKFINSQREVFDKNEFSITTSSYGEHKKR